MSVSTAPTAIANLIAAIKLQSAAISQDVFPFGIQRGEPIHDWPVDDGIYISQTNRTLQRLEMRAGTVGYLREDYVLVVEIAVFRGGDAVAPGDTTSAIEQRCWDLVNAVETAVRNDLTLAGAVPEAFPESSVIVSEWDPDNAGRRVRATVHVHCWAFI